MEPWQRDAIRSNIRTLIRHIPTKRVLDFMLYDGLVNAMTVELILALPLYCRNYALLAMLVSMGSNVFHWFQLALNQAGRSDLTALLNVHQDFKEMKI